MELESFVKTCSRFDVLTKHSNSIPSVAMFNQPAVPLYSSFDLPVAIV